MRPRAWGLHLKSEPWAHIACSFSMHRPGDAARPTTVPNLSVIPAEPDLTGAEIELVSLERREYRLRDALAPLRAGQSDFDYVLIDCPPSLGLLTVNALVAADAVLVPLQCEFYALEGIRRIDPDH